MKSVRIYYAGIPAKNTNPEKREVLSSFHKGCPQGISKEIETRTWEPADLAVMQGWVHANSGTTPHLMFRRDIIQRQKQYGGHTLAIDSNLFLYADHGNTRKYLRFSLDDVFPTTGNYFTDNVDPKRWQKISNDLGIYLKPWQQKGKHILICLQRNGGWSMGGFDVMDWCNKTINEIKKHTDRPIVVRAHPGDGKAKQYLKLNHPGVKISKNAHILEDFRKAHAVVTYNSSPGVAAAIEGIPVFVTDHTPQKSQAFDVCNTDLKLLENPNLPDRQKWIEKISMSHYNFQDLKMGIAWDIIKEYI